jgi:hypothetical protein
MVCSMKGNRDQPVHAEQYQLCFLGPQSGGSSDGGQLGVAGSEASEVLVGLHELKALVPVHVCQGSSRSPAHACMSHSTVWTDVCFV